MLDCRLENQSPKTAVLVLNWQGEKLIRDCLEALKGQTYGDFLGVVADNASGDSSCEIIRAEYPQVLLYAFDENYGFARGNNEAVRLLLKTYPSLEYIVLLNNDTKAEPGWLQGLVEAAEADPKLGSVASQLVCWDGENPPERIDSAGDMFHKHGVPGKRGYGEPRDSYQDDSRVFGACAGAALYRVAALNDTGLLDEDFFAYNEDVDLAFRLRLRGWGCHFAPASTVWHRVGFSSGRYSDRSIYWARRNSLWTVMKDVPGGLLWRYGLQMFLYALCSDILWCARGRFKPVLKGRFDALRAWSSVMEKRRAIQSSRRITNDELRSLMVLKTPWLESFARNLGLQGK